MSYASVEMVVGSQRPRVSYIPPYVRSAGDAAIELAALAGLYLDDWQQYVLRHALGETPDQKWTAQEIGLCVSRQCGKGAILEARQLFGLFILEEALQVHSAHLWDTVSSHFRRLAERIEHTPELNDRLEKKRGGGGILYAKGGESITLARNPLTGRQPRLEMRTRTGGGGLGMSIDTLYIDEAMIVSDEMHQALIPTLSARPNMQVWYTGSAPDELNPTHKGIPFARIREKGKREEGRLAYFEWSLPYDDPTEIPAEVIASEEAWAEANPGLGIRISADYIREVELGSMSPQGFAIQRLGVGRWPRTDGLTEQVIPPEKWELCSDEASKREGHICLAVDVNPERSYAAISIAGYREDKRIHTEVIEHRRGVNWVAERVAELRNAHDRRAPVVLDAAMAGSILPELTARNIAITPAGIKDHAAACATFFDAVAQDSLRHIGQSELTEALRGAKKRNVGDGWAWSRKDSTDICPLVACTLAVWGLTSLVKRSPEIMDLNSMYEEMKENGEL